MISLEEKEIRFLVKSINNNCDKNWFTDGIVAKLQDDLERQENISKCKHDFKEYVGQKTCCSKCDAYGVGDGFSWVLKEFLEEKAGGV